MNLRRGCLAGKEAFIIIPDQTALLRQKQTPDHPIHRNNNNEGYGTVYINIERLLKEDFKKRFNKSTVKLHNIKDFKSWR